MNKVLHSFRTINKYLFNFIIIIDPLLYLLILSKILRYEVYNIFIYFYILYRNFFIIRNIKSLADIKLITTNN